MPEQNKTEPKPPHHPHDKGYRQLLSNKRTFLELLRTFVKEGWVQEIAAEDLILINKSYILQDFHEKEADIVYRLRFRDTEIIFYILLELQSTVDHTMPFRLLQYMLEIWRDIYNNTPDNERTQKGFRLPAIIPAVLYNGGDTWTACPSFREYQSGQDRFPEHLLDFSYILFDVNSYNDNDLYRAANVIASIFYLDRVIDPKKLVKRIKTLAKVLKTMEPEQLRQVIIWLKNIFKHKLPKQLHKEIDRILKQISPQEVDEMITNIERALEELQQQALMEGAERGKTEGRLEGRLEGKLESQIDIAKAALREGLDVDVVCKITGLPRETVINLKNALEN